MSIADKLKEVAQNQQRVYDAGYEKSQDDIEHLNAELEQTLYGTDSGGKSHYDEFWDVYQQNGDRIYYNYAFFGDGWSDQNFNPKYDILVGNDNHKGNGALMFYDSLIPDIGAKLKENGVILDTSLAMNLNQMFQGAKTKTIPEISFVSHRNPYCVFMNCTELETIEKIIITDTSHYDRWFNACGQLENLTIEGAIGQNGFDFHWSPLSKASLTSIINALSSTTTGLTVTLRLAAVNTAFETTAGAADGSTSDEWLALVATKSNWTINLINS